MNPNMTRAQRLTAQAAEAAEVRAATTHPDVVALRVEQSRPVVEMFIWAGIIIGLAFTMTNVQQFAADTTGAVYGSLEWWACWLLDPTVSLVLLGILFAERHTARWQIADMETVKASKWALLAATYVMNTWHSYATANLAGIVLHSVPPLVAFVGAIMVTRLQDRLTECVHRAHDDAAKRTGQSAVRNPQPESVWTAPVVDYPTVKPQPNYPQPSPYSPLNRPVKPAFPVPSAPSDGRPSLFERMQSADRTGPAQPVPNGTEPVRTEPKPEPAPVRPPTVSPAQPRRTETGSVRNKADIQAARKVADRLARSGQPLTRDRLVAGLRTDHYTCSNGLASQLLVELRSTKLDRPRLHVAGGA